MGEKGDIGPVAEIPLDPHLLEEELLEDIDRHGEGRIVRMAERRRREGAVNVVGGNRLFDQLEAGSTGPSLGRERSGRTYPLSAQATKAGSDLPAHLLGRQASHRHDQQSVPVEQPGVMGFQVCNRQAGE